MAARESYADVASLRHLLRPASVAVIGASRRRGSQGREILHNIVTGGFAGPVYAVNPHARSMEGLRCVHSVAGLPRQLDLAVIAVPAPTVPQVAAECGHRGVRSLVVITSGLGAQGADLLAICRRHGMRLVGPNCFGVDVPGIGLDATFAAGRPLPGAAGVVVQSGGVGVSLLAHLSRLGIGVSSFASVGNKYDVSSNDMLTWWEQDGQTKLAVLYVESFGSPRKFARTARRVGQRMPVLTVISGRSAAGQRAAATHTAAAATPLVTQEALFAQAGIVVARSLGELVEAAALVASQPLPEGNRVAVISNAGGAGVLAADACGDHGLRLATLSKPTQRRLSGLLPPGAAVAGPAPATLRWRTRRYRRIARSGCYCPAMSSYGPRLARPLSRRLTRKKAGPARGGDSAGHGDAQSDGADARGPVSRHGELGAHLQPVALEAVSRQVPAGVVGHARGQRPDQELGRGRRRVRAAGTGRLVGQDSVAPGGDRVRLAACVGDVDPPRHGWAGCARPGIAVSGCGLREQRRGEPPGLRWGQPGPAAVIPSR